VTLPKVKTVNVVTMQHGRKFAEGWFQQSIDDSCDDTGVLTWPGDDKDDPSDDAAERFHELTNDICRHVYEATKDQIAEAFVRIANAVIEGERTRIEGPLIPPRVEMVETVTPEHGLTFAEQMHRETADTELFYMALSATQIMTFPDDGPNGEEAAAQTHFHNLTDEIRDRLHEETKQLIADAFVRVVGDVITRERHRR
jgi:hypothetical protein